MCNDDREILPELSVIIPAYNASKTIKRALDSLLDQTVSLDYYEIIVIDDGSSDDTWEICKRYAVKYSNIRVVHQDNGGVSSARNRGLSLVKSRWVTFVDSDDYVSPDYVNVVISTAPDVDYLIFNHFLKTDNKCMMGKPWLKNWSQQKINIHQVMLWICDNQLNSPCDKRFSVQVIRDNHISFAQSIHIGEDLLFNYSYARGVDSAYICDRGIYYYVDNLASATHKPANFQCLSEYEEIYHTMALYTKEKIYIRTLNESFLRVIAIYAGQLYKAGYAVNEMSQLFASCDMVNAIMYDRSWNIKNIVRRILLRMRWYNLCAILFQG